jgi:hypothetical protein
MGGTHKPYPTLRQAAREYALQTGRCTHAHSLDTWWVTDAVHLAWCCLGGAAMREAEDFLLYLPGSGSSIKGRRDQSPWTDVVHGGRLELSPGEVPASARAVLRKLWEVC